MSALCAPAEGRCRGPPARARARSPVRHDNRGAPHADAVQRVLHCPLAGRVESRRGLVQEHHLGFGFMFGVWGHEGCGFTPTGLEVAGG